MNLILEKCSEKVKNIALELKQELQIDGGRGDVALSVRERPEPGFSLDVEDGAAELAFGSVPALCRGLLTLYSAKTHTFHREERSCCKELGYMVDCSRNAVIRLEQLKKMIRVLALMGYTYIGLYMEDTIAVKEEPYLGYMRGAMTPSELKEADAYAKQFGMEIRPYIQTLAHFNQITRYEHYYEMIDCDDILLAGEEKTYEFLEHLIQTLSETLSTRNINIGMDEAHMVGLGKYLSQHGYTERFQIMEKHLERVLSITRKYGYKAQMWSDMFFRLAYDGQYYVKDKEIEYQLNIPSDVKLMYWDYYSLDTNHYDQMIVQHKKITENVGFAGGAWKWHGFVPHNHFSYHASVAAFKACRKNQIDSIVITGWGDNGGEASQFSNLPALYADAEFAYTYCAENDETMETEKFKVLTGITYDEFMLMDDVNLLPEDKKKTANSSKYLLYNDLLIGTFDSVVNKEVATHYASVAKTMQQLSKVSTYGYLFKTQEMLCRLLSLKSDLGLRIRGAYKAGDKAALERIAREDLPTLLLYVDDFYHAFEQQWHLENKSFGFEVQCVRIGGLKQRIDYVKDILERYLANEVTQIDELEIEYLPFAYSSGDDIRQLGYNLWRNTVSPSVV
ncbi:MAG: beta-N-acetylhexosaminidase [Lachnospiraceae bacterium]|nr:beta-N-acetylhexosaminidase [Lachnospiraceae bacterium]